MTPSRPSKDHPATRAMSVYEKSTPKAFKKVIPWVGLALSTVPVGMFVMNSQIVRDGSSLIFMIAIFVVALFMMMPRGTLKLFEKIPIPKFMQR
jgi:hypothetical protein